MPVVKLDARNVKRLRALNGRRTEYVDQLLPGLALRVSPDGSRSYCVRYRVPGRRQQRYTLDDEVQLGGLAAARAAARDVLKRVAAGHDPQAERVEARRQRDHGTVKQLWAAFLAAKPRKRGGEWRPATEAIYRSAFEQHILPRFGKDDPDALRPEQLRLFLDRIARDTPAMSLRVLEAFRRCYTWALSRGYVRANPFLGVEPPAQKPRAVRVFTNDEIRGIFAAVRGTELEDLVPLIFHTATRSHETRAARGEHFEEERALWTIPPELSKTGEITQQAHLVPLSVGALRVLQRITAKVEALEAEKVVLMRQRGYLFPAPTDTGHMDKPNKATAAVKKAIGMKDDERGFLHHIRRTVSDRMKSDLGVHPYVVECILGHAQPGLGKTYTPTVPLEQMREALQLWSDELERILAGQAKGDEGKAKTQQA